MRPLPTQVCPDVREYTTASEVLHVPSGRQRPVAPLLFMSCGASAGPAAQRRPGTHTRAFPGKPCAGHPTRTKSVPSAAAEMGMLHDNDGQATSLHMDGARHRRVAVNSHHSAHTAASGIRRHADPNFRGHLPTLSALTLSALSATSTRADTAAWRRPHRNVRTALLPPTSAAPTHPVALPCLIAGLGR